MADITTLIEDGSGRWYRTATKSMRTLTRDDRHYPILVKAYGKRSYGEDRALAPHCRKTNN
jgi:hypothetical protein